jgi:TonB family protein
MSATDHIKQYSAADIQRYLEGGMLPAEMHELEKAALEDPFLADAIEGMQQTLEQHDASLIQGHLQDIRQQVAERTRQEDSTKVVAPVRAFRWWQVAAAAVVVLTGSIWALNYFNQSEAKNADKQLAVVTQEQNANEAPLTLADSAAPSVADKATSKAATDSTIVSSQHFSVSTNDAGNSNWRSNPASPLEQPLPYLKAKEEVAANQPAAVHDKLPAKPVKDMPAVSLAENKQAFDDKHNYAFKKADTVNGGTFDQYKAVDNANSRKAFYNSLDKTYTTKPSDFEQIVVADKKKDSNGRDFYGKPEELAMNRSRKELSEKQAKKNPNALLSGFISGRVTDQSNNPLSNALLRAEDNRIFYTDRQGQFKIPVKDTVSVLNIAVASTGYYTQNVQLFNNSQSFNANYNNISLNQLGVKAPNPQLNEAIRIRGVSTVRQGDSTVISRNNYPEVMVQDAQPEDGWLEFQQYLEKNKQTPPGTPQLTGVVVVSFHVNKKGDLSDFKIEQSLDKAYDDEALRLIKAGPAWKLNKGRKTKVTVLVRF